MASADWAWMAVVAGEELAKLEAAHPGRLGPLKAELKHLIAEPGWDGAGFFPLASPDGGTPTWSPSPCQSATPADLTLTQESTNRKRKWGGGGGGGAVGQEQGKRRRKVAASGVKDRADMAIERAKKCLKRIRAIKQSLLSSTD